MANWTYIKLANRIARELNADVYALAGQTRVKRIKSNDSDAYTRLATLLADLGFRSSGNTAVERGGIQQAWHGHGLTVTASNVQISKGYDSKVTKTLLIAVMATPTR